MNLTDPSALLTLLQTSGYFIMFLIMIPEGPIITYVAAFAASLGVFNIYTVFILSLLGNIIGDLVVFLIGRYAGKWALKKFVSSKTGEEKLENLKKKIHTNPGKTVAVVKLTPALPVPGILTLGSLDLSLKTFMFYSFIISLIYSAVFTVLGYYSGVAFIELSKYIKYGELLIGGAVLLTIGLWFLVRYLSTKVSKNL